MLKISFKNLLQNNKSTKICDVGIFTAQKPQNIAASTLERAPVSDVFCSVGVSAPVKDIGDEILDASLKASLLQDRWGSRNPIFYRIVGKDELLKLIKGQAVKSNRDAYKGLYTDITTDPMYDKIPRNGKFRLKFNNENNKLINSGRLRVWAPENSHYQISGHYDASDIKTVDYFDGDDVISLGSIDELRSLF